MTKVLTIEALQEIFLLSLKELLPSLRMFSDKQLITKIGKEKLEDIVCQLEDFLIPSCGEISRNERLAISSQVLNCLANYIKMIDIPVTLNTVCNNFHLLSYAVDRAFPAYASAGLLKCVISPGQIGQMRVVA